MLGCGERYNPLRRFYLRSEVLVGCGRLHLKPQPLDRLDRLNSLNSLDRPNSLSGLNSLNSLNSLGGLDDVDRWLQLRPGSRGKTVLRVRNME